VGDRYVLGMLRDTGGILGGGDVRGTILCLDKDDDRRRTRQRPCRFLGRHEKDGVCPLAELASGMLKFPQVLLKREGRGKRFDPSSVPGPCRTRFRGIEKRMGGERAGGIACLRH